MFNQSGEGTMAKQIEDCTTLELPIEVKRGRGRPKSPHPKTAAERKRDQRYRRSQELLAALSKNGNDEALAEIPQAVLFENLPWFVSNGKTWIVADLCRELMRRTKENR
jgi:hypothetical protein